MNDFIIHLKLTQHCKSTILQLKERVHCAILQWLVHMCVLSCFHCVRLFATPWTVAHQATLSMGFSRQEY